jgi:hypothetical protein
MERIVSEVDAAITELKESRSPGHPAGAQAVAPTNGSAGPSLGPEAEAQAVR